MHATQPTEGTRVKYSARGMSELHECADLWMARDNILYTAPTRTQLSRRHAVWRSERYARWSSRTRGKPFQPGGDHPPRGRELAETEVQSCVYDRKGIGANYVFAPNADRTRVLITIVSSQKGLTERGVVSTRNVTERLPFVNSFAAVFRKGVLEFVWIKLLGQFQGKFPKACGVVIAGSMNRVGVPFSRELRACAFSKLKLFLILHIIDNRWIPALVVRCCSEAAPFLCTARLN